MLDSRLRQEVVTAIQWDEHLARNEAAYESPYGPYLHDAHYAEMVTPSV